ncbi:MAG TPA: DUF302 domain-containing protein [Mycobacteriales bacterium]|nr:DUF302 domain-containing protein [Mycobacteriales bacterium]
MKNYYRAVVVAADFATAVERVRAELAAEGFGVITEVDVAATLKAKLGVTFEDYVILGACIPPLAHEALKADRRMGLLLPCNVVVRSEGSETVVETLDPKLLVALADNSELDWIADDAGARLERVLTRVACS